MSDIYIFYFPHDLILLRINDKRSSLKLIFQLYFRKCNVIIDNQFKLIDGTTHKTCPISIDHNHFCRYDDMKWKLKYEPYFNERLVAEVNLCFDSFKYNEVLINLESFV